MTLIKISLLVVCVFIRIFGDFWLSESSNITWLNGSTDTPWSHQDMAAFGFSYTTSTIYLLGGCHYHPANVSLMDTIYTFNPITYQFSLLNNTSPYPFRVDAPQLSVTLNDNIIILSPTKWKGRDGGWHSGLIYNMINNTFDLKTFVLLPYFIYGNECVISNNIDMIYVIGGGNLGETNTIYGYNFTTNRWVKHLATMHEYREIPGCQYYNGTIYVFGGIHDYTTVSNTIEKYIISQDKWILLNTTLLNVNGEHEEASNVILFQDSILLIGGASDGFPINSVQYFDLKTEKIDPTKTTFLNGNGPVSACINWKNETIFVFCGGYWEYGIYV